MTQQTFAVNHKLQAIQLNKLTQQNRRLIRGSATRAAPKRQERALVEGHSSLKINHLYPSSAQRRRRYYLPAYAVAKDDAGRPAVRLERVPAESGEVGRLVIDFQWTPPPGGRGLDLQVMAHEADLVLEYRMPVGNASQTAPGPGLRIDLQPLRMTGSDSAQSITVFADDVEFARVYAAMRHQVHQARLEILLSAAVWVRTWRQVMVKAPSAKDQIKTFDRRHALFTELVDKKKLNRTALGRTGRVKIATPAVESSKETDAARRVLEKRRRLGAAGHARARPRQGGIGSGAVLRQGSVAPSVVIAQPAVISAAGVRVAAGRQRGGKRVAKRGTRRVVKKNGKRVVVRVAGQGAKRAGKRSVGKRVRVRGTGSRRAKTSAKVTGKKRAGVRRGGAARGKRVRRVVVRTPEQRQAALEAAVRDRRVKPVMDANIAARVYAPRLQRAVAATDLKVTGIKAVPLRLALDHKKAPALLDAELEGRHAIPFHFDAALAEHRNIYAAAGEGAPINILQPLQLVEADGQNRIVYQDQLQREVVHVPPTEFRLLRSAQTPFAPSIGFLPAEFATAEGDDEAEVFFEMAMNYQLAPWTDPRILDLAREALRQEGRVARFVSLVPEAADLSLDLDFLGDDRHRREAEVEHHGHQGGFNDVLQLDQDTFTQLWRSQLSQPGGIGGSVRQTWFDGTEVNAPVRMSFWQESDEVVESRLLEADPEQPDHYVVRLRNRIESPVTLRGLPAELLADGAVASVVDKAEWLGQTLPPQGSVDVVYQVEPAGTGVVHLEPVVVAEVGPDLNALLRRLLIKPGFESLGFALSVSALEGSFGPPEDGGSAVVGLVVEFDDGSRVELSEDEPEVEAQLSGRLLDQLMGQADDQQRYFYRVTNVHPDGEGARTSWFEGAGDTPLEVGPAFVALESDLDF